MRRALCRAWLDLDIAVSGRPDAMPALPRAVDSFGRDGTVADLRSGAGPRVGPPCCDDRDEKESPQSSPLGFSLGVKMRRSSSSDTVSARGSPLYMTASRLASFRVIATPTAFATAMIAANPNSPARQRCT